VKSEGAIRHKIKQVRFRYLKRSIEEGLDRRPHNCRHNAIMDGAGDAAVRLCLAQVDAQARTITVCDERFGGCERAAACPLFTPTHTKEGLKANFYRDLEAMSFPEIAYNYPDMAALLWVLADEGVPVPPPDPHEFDLRETVAPEPDPTPEPEPALPEPEPEPALPEPEPVHELSVRQPSWIDRLLGRVSS